MCIRDSDESGSPIGLALVVSEAGTGTALLDWAFREEYAGDWVDIASGQQYVSYGEQVELVTGQPGTTIMLTATEMAPHAE